MESNPARAQAITQRPAPSHPIARGMAFALTFPKRQPLAAMEHGTPSFLAVTLNTEALATAIEQNAIEDALGPFETALYVLALLKAHSRGFRKRKRISAPDGSDTPIMPPRRTTCLPEPAALIVVRVI